MKIYTRMGDGGETGLLGGRRLPKNDAIFELLGNLDETNAAIGLATSYFSNGRFPTKELHRIQETLLAIGSCVADSDPASAPVLSVLEKMTDSFEKQIDQWDKTLPPLKNFILPEGVPGAAALHYARTLVRRTERSYYRWEGAAQTLPIGRYLNRLSDYLFQAARYANHLENHPEQIWHS